MNHKSGHAVFIPELIIIIIKRVRAIVIRMRDKKPEG